MDNKLSILIRMAISVAVIAFLCTGADTAVYTSKVTGARKRTHCVYIPYWLGPARAFNLYRREEKIPSAVEWFMLKHAFHGSAPVECWNLDAISRGTYWGLTDIMDPKSPGRYLLLASDGNESFLYVFLEKYAGAHPEFASEVARFFEHREADSTINWWS